MIKNVDLIKSLLVYGGLRCFLDYKNKFVKHFIKNVLFIRKFFLIDVNYSSYVISKKTALTPKSFFYKSIVFEFLVGLDTLFISKTGKNLFVSWLDSYGRFKLIKSLMTLSDPKKQTTKKQKGFSAYFILKKYGRTLRKRYRLSHVALLIKGSLGIRRKKFFATGISHSGLKIQSIIDITNVPFNGCRLKRRRRL
jgi:ribosomal protein S11